MPRMACCLLSNHNFTMYRFEFVKVYTEPEPEPKPAYTREKAVVVVRKSHQPESWDVANWNVQTIADKESERERVKELSHVLSIELSNVRRWINVALLHPDRVLGLRHRWINVDRRERVWQKAKKRVFFHIHDDLYVSSVRLSVNGVPRQSVIRNPQNC